MPLVDVDPVLVKPVEATGHAVPVALKTAVVETRFKPLQSLLTQISGSIYVVEYYRQLLGANDTPKPLQLELAAPYQQYDKIRQLEIRLQGDLSYSANEEGRTQDVTGEAILYPGLPPNDGDMLVADAGAGRRGLFQVTATEQLSYYQQTCFRITFSLVCLLDQDPVRAQNLEEKVVAIKHFVKDFMRAGKNPIIIDSLYSDYRDLARLRESMVADYLRQFFSEVSQTLLIPDQTAACYDHFLAKAVVGVLETMQSRVLRKLNVYNMDAQYGFRTTTLWDALLLMDPSLLYLASHQIGLTDRQIVYSRAHFSGAYWAKIDYFMYPLEPREDADAERSYNPYVAPWGLKEGNSPVQDFARIVDNKVVDAVQVVDQPTPGASVPLIHPVTIDAYYVFSRAFYQEDPTQQSVLEQLVWSVLNQNDLDVPTLATLVRASKRWGRLEQFYYIPVLMILSVLALRGPSSI